MPDALDRSRVLNGQRQVRLFRVTGGESAWMPEFDAGQVVMRLPAEWAFEPWNGQSYGAPSDRFAVEVTRGEVQPMTRNPTLRPSW